MVAEGRWLGSRIGPLDWCIAIGVALLWLLVLRAGPLSLPYFWDEADVYVPGSIWVAQHGLDVRPGVFPDDYSRGHPVLLYLLAGIAFRLFGAAPTVGHLVVLPFSVLALAGTYLLGAITFGRRVGIAAALLLGTTPLFLSIGAMLLPEPPLVGLTVLALIFFARGRLWPAALCGALLVCIKETGIFTAGAITAAVLWQGWRQAVLWRGPTLRRAALAATPLLVLCAFFLWQRLSPAGYFIFPHHQNLLFERPFALADLATAWPSLLLWHGRWVVMAAAALFLVVLAATGRLQRPSAEEHSDSSERWRPLPSTVVVAMLVLVVENALFFSKMFWLERYALPAHPGLLVVACAVLMGCCSRNADTYRRLRLVAPWAPVAAAVVLGLASLGAPTRANEEELTFAYADVIETHRLTYQALEEWRSEQNEPDADPLIVTSWPMTIELRNPTLGYVSRPHRTVHIDSAGNGDREVAAAIIPEGSRHTPPLRDLATGLGLRRLGRYRSGESVPALELWVRP